MEEYCQIKPPSKFFQKLNSRLCSWERGWGLGDSGWQQHIGNLAVLQTRAANLTFLVHNENCTLTLEIRPLATLLEMISLLTLARGLSCSLFQHKQPGKGFGAAKGVRLGVSHCAVLPRNAPTPSSPLPPNQKLLFSPKRKKKSIPLSSLSRAGGKRRLTASGTRVPAPCHRLGGGRGMMFASYF